MPFTFFSADRCIQTDTHTHTHTHIKSQTQLIIQPTSRLLLAWVKIRNKSSPVISEEYVTALHNGECTRPLCMLAVQCPLQTSPTTQPRVGNIHTTVPHFSYKLGLHWVVWFPPPKNKFVPSHWMISTRTIKKSSNSPPHTQGNVNLVYTFQTDRKTNTQTDKWDRRQVNSESAYVLLYR